MSGHSHWAKVKRAKGATDVKRGKVWGKLARRIIVAARGGGGSPAENLSLRYAIDEARAANMPNDTIDRAIKKGTGELGGENYEAAMYEAYGPGGVAFMIECLTNNRSRTAPELRSILERHGGQLAASNAVAWMFVRKGAFTVAAEAADEDTLMELALEAGAEDVRLDEDVYEVTCEIPAFAAVRDALAKANIATISSQLAMLPTSTVQIAGDVARQVIKLVEALEENDDVQNVYSNFEMPSETMEAEGS